MTDTKNKAGARLAKRIILGKQKPPVVLRVLSWFTIIWSFLIAVFMAGAGLYAYLESDFLSQTNGLADFTPKFCFSYATLHGLSLFSGILTYRKKLSGFYLYVITNVLMVILPFVLLNNAQFELIPVVFTLIMIGLYFTQYNKMG